MPARMTCFLPVALTAARKSLLSHALTSPVRLMNGASGCMSVISLGSGPFGPVGARQRDGRRVLRWGIYGPVSELVVRIVGRLNTFAIAA